MKILMTMLFSFLTLTIPAHAIDEAGINQLKQLGFEVRMGELTGAGSKISTRRLAGFIHPNGIIMKSDIKSLIVKKSTEADPKISDITQVIVDQSKLSAAEFEGFFITQ